VGASSYVSAKTEGASLRLCHLGKKFHDILQVMKLLTVFDVYDTQAAAVSSFQLWDLPGPPPAEHNAVIAEILSAKPFATVSSMPQLGMSS
jgi:hypothetical protein